MRHHEHGRAGNGSRDRRLGDTVAGWAKSSEMAINELRHTADRPTVTGLLWRAKSRSADSDAGFTMMEIVVSLLVIAIVTTGSLTFFINNLRSVNGQNQRQQAVNLANQQLETVQSLPVDKLVSGRTSAMVTALVATTAATRLKISTQDDTSSSANYDATAGSDPLTVPTQSTKSVNGVTYTIYTFIDTCWYATSTGLCGPTSSATKAQEYRASIDVAWQSNGQCINGCDYSTSTLIDPTANPQFNSNISTPSGNYDSVGSDNNPGLNPNVASMSQLSDTCTINGITTNGTKIVVTGTGFKNNIRVWISAGGGTIPTSSIYQPIAGEVDFCLQTSDVPGGYTISVINTDGGHFQLPITEVPSITVANGWDPTNKQLMLTGTGFEPGVVFTASNGATFTGTSNASFGNTATNDTVTLTNYVGTKDGASTTITATNPDTSAATFTITAPAISSFAPSALAAGTTQSIALTGSGYKSTTTAVVTNANGTASISSVTSSSSATMTSSPTTVGTQGFYVYNTNGGFTSTKSITVNAQPTATSVTPAEVTEDVLSGTVTVNGTGFQVGMTAASNNGTVSLFTRVSSTQVTFKVTPLNFGSDVITLTNPDGGSVNVTLIVPNITSFTPNPPVHSTATTWTVNGSGFESGATVTITENGTNLPVSNTTFVNSTKITFKATTTASSGSFLNFVVTVKNPDNSQDSQTQSMKPT